LSEFFGVRGATVEAGARPSFGHRTFLLLFAAGEGLADEDADQGRDEQPAGEQNPEHWISAFPIAMVWSAPRVDGRCSDNDVCAARRSGWRRGCFSARWQRAGCGVVILRRPVI